MISVVLIWFAVGICLYLAGTHYQYGSPLVIWLSAAWPGALFCLLIGIMVLILATAYNYPFTGTERHD